MEVLTSLAIGTKAALLEVPADLGFVKFVRHHFAPEFGFSVGEAAVAAELAELGLLEVLADLGLVLFGKLKLKERVLGGLLVELEQVSG